MLCLFAGGVANAKYANDNDNFLDERRSFCDDNPEQDYTCDDIETVRNYEAISAVSVVLILDGNVTTHIMQCNV